ncbi:MAG TPA: S-adenosylmethionine:tRNA ribosyltransferase-isomerase [Ramlibacter sp.]|nr:S-adenosylmethionine:tRNA ribosyltransferase-isomerase [Ramlibacter sp.]
MRAAVTPLQRPRGAKLLAVDAHGRIRHEDRARLADFMHAGDVLVANDAATLPASLAGVDQRTGRSIEVRLAGRASLDVNDVREFSAVLFGEGDWRTPTEHRVPPPFVEPGDALALGPLRATVIGQLGHARLLQLRFSGEPGAIWAGLARHGKPVQYAHMREPLKLWDVWTSVAALPVAYEPPSAGFAVDWALLAALKAKGVVFATLTHAAGLSSTGDAALDARLPLDEPYHIPAATVRAIREAKARGARVIATGTTVTRALEHAAASRGLKAGAGVADQKIGAHTRLEIVDAIVSGTHEPGTSHYELLRAFASDAVLRRASAELEAHGYLTHEFGDSVWIEHSTREPATPSRLGASSPAMLSALPW